MRQWKICMLLFCRTYNILNLQCREGRTSKCSKTRQQLRGKTVEYLNNLDRTFSARYRLVFSFCFQFLVCPSSIDVFVLFK